MPQFMLSVHHDTSEDLTAMTPEEIQPIYEAVDAFNQELQSSGAWVFAGGLQPIEDSTTVDATGSDVVVTDGPFAESKEYLGGFWVVAAPDLDAAIDLARRGSKACAGKVEVRPFQPEPDETA
jgi:hypothetical protein